MSTRVNRREFVLSGAAVVAAASVKASAGQAQAPSQAPTMMVNRTVRPVVIASNNGNVDRNGGDITAVAKAFNLITGGSDVLDALIAGVNLCELDPLDASVGTDRARLRNGAICEGRRKVRRHLSGLTEIAPTG